MTITKEKTAQLVKKFGSSETDTGNPAVQVAILTEEINALTDHMKDHIHDYHSQRGLLKKVGQRKNLLNYLVKHDVNRYRALIKELGLRK